MADLILRQTGIQEWCDPSGDVRLEVTEWMPMYVEVQSGVPGGPYVHSWPVDKRLADRMGLGPIGGIGPDA